MGRIHRTRQARDDVLSIWEYIAQDNAEAADKMVRKFDAILEQLAEHPGMGTPQFQYRAGLRCVPVGKYLIFYDPVEDGIRVIRVLHGARRLEDLL